MELKIRHAVLEDVPAINDITQEAFEKYAIDMGLPGTVSALKETPDIIENELSEKIILIAELDGIPVGSIRYEMTDDNVAYISRFGVKLNTQNCGVGKGLIQAVEAEARVKGAHLIVLHTSSKLTALVRLYYGMGFYIHSTTSDRGYIRALFCKELVDEGLPSLDNFI